MAPPSSPHKQSGGTQRRGNGLHLDPPSPLSHTRSFPSTSSPASSATTDRPATAGPAQSASKIVYGLTPAFELTDDPLSQDYNPATGAGVASAAFDGSSSSSGSGRHRQRIEASANPNEPTHSHRHRIGHQHQPSSWGVVSDPEQRSTMAGAAHSAASFAASSSPFAAAVAGHLASPSGSRSVSPLAAVEDRSRNRNGTNGTAPFAAAEDFSPKSEGLMALDPSHHQNHSHRPLGDLQNTATASAMSTRHSIHGHHSPHLPWTADEPHFRTATPPTRTDSAQSSSRFYHPPPHSAEPLKRQSSISRAAASAAQSIFDNLSGRGSPRLNRPPMRSNSSREAKSNKSDAEQTEDEDEEAGKGHGRGHHEHWNGRSRSAMGNRKTPRPHSVSSRRPLEKRGSAVEEAEVNGRRTPAKYRPDPEKTKPVKSWSSDANMSPGVADAHAAIPVGHDPTYSGDGSSSGYSSHGKPTSPIVIPQARRGGLNLQNKSKRRTKGKGGKKKAYRGSLRASVPARSCLPATWSFLCSACWHAGHPIHTVRMAKLNICSTARSVDVAFRCPHTGVRVWRPEWIGAYIPLLIWLGVSVTSTLTVLIFHTQVFRGLDQLSRTLQGLGLGGRLILGSLIFITTFPPLPLYSTLIILCGFSFGLWQGFLISYIAALSGAIVVFLLSKSLLRGWMNNLLAKSGGLKRVVRAIEKRPSLLFLIRLAPYPYNLMNTLLASSATLTFKTYVLCTALSLFKLLVHCGLGTSIKNFAAYNGAGHGSASSTSASSNSNSSLSLGVDASPDGTTTTGTTSSTATAESVKRIVGILGVGLCIGIFLYLFTVARRAVDEELDEEDEDDGEEKDDYGDDDGARVGEEKRRSSKRKSKAKAIAMGAAGGGGGAGEYEVLSLGVDEDEDEDDDDDDSASDGQGPHSDSDLEDGNLPLQTMSSIPLFPPPTSSSSSSLQHTKTGAPVSIQPAWLMDQGPKTYPPAPAQAPAHAQAPTWLASSHLSHSHGHGHGHGERGLVDEEEEDDDEEDQTFRIASPDHIDTDLS